MGQVVHFGAYTDAQTNLPGSAPPPCALRRLDASLVGIVDDPGTVASDEADNGIALQIFTPALTQQLSCCSNYPLPGSP